jgi:geranylgeranyl diphosphate synthase type I
MDSTCVRVCEGQFLDISFESRTDVTAERYRVMAARKTGALFGASAHSAAMLASDDPTVRDQLARFGEEFGQAFQAHDDLLGIWATTERTGKVEMNDLVKRKKTLPVVLAFERASPRVRAQLDELFAPQAPLPAENVERIRTILDELGVRPMLEREIQAHRGRALGVLHGIAAREESLRLLDHLVASATGAADEPAAAGTLSA